MFWEVLNLKTRKYLFGSYASPLACCSRQYFTLDGSLIVSSDLFMFVFHLLVPVYLKIVPPVIKKN